MAKRPIRPKDPLTIALAAVRESKLQFVAGTEQVKIGYNAALERVELALRRRFAQKWGS